MKIKVIVNKASRSGAKRHRLDIIRQAFSEHDCQVFIPTSRKELDVIASSSRVDGTELVVVVGGDGTVNAVTNQLVGSSVKIGIVPAGTANDLARHLGIPKDPAEACQIILNGTSRAIDLVEINGRYFATGGGMGTISAVACGVNWLKAQQGLVRRTTKQFGSWVYILYSFLLLTFSSRLASPISLTVDGRLIGNFDAVACFAHNQPTIGKTVAACPDAEADDGLFNLCLMKKRNRFQSIFTVILMGLKGMHTDRDDIELWDAKSVEIKMPKAKTFIGDGEVLAKSERLSLRIVPKALNVLVPAA